MCAAVAPRSRVAAGPRVYAECRVSDLPTVWWDTRTRGRLDDSGRMRLATRVSIICLDSAAVGGSGASSATSAGVADAGSPRSRRSAAAELIRVIALRRAHGGCLRCQSLSCATRKDLLDALVDPLLGAM